MAKKKRKAAKLNKQEGQETKPESPSTPEANTLVPAFILAVCVGIFFLIVQHGHIKLEVFEDYQTFSQGFLTNILCSVSVLHSRLTMHQHKEPLYIRLPIAAGLAVSAFYWESLGIIPLFAMQIATYLPLSNLSMTTSAAILALLAILASNFRHFLLLLQLLASPFRSYLEYMLPLSEFSNAYSTVYSFIGDDMYMPFLHLIYVTVNIQITLGYVGISYLISYQTRSLQLINKVAGKGTSAARIHFWRVLRFIMTVSLPYLLHRTCMEIANDYAYLRIKNQIRFVVRDSPMSALADAPHGPEDYANSVATVVGTMYRIVDRKLFSMPKLALLPPIIWAHPVAMGTIFPFAILADKGRNYMLSALTTQITETSRSKDELNSKRRQIEEFDRKNVQNMERSGGEIFARQRRQNLTHEIHSLQAQINVLSNGRSFIQWLYWKDLLLPTLEIGTASLLALDKIDVSEITVYSRVIEDAIDLILMRSRNEAQLVQMGVEISKLEALRDLIEGRSENHLPCAVGDEFRLQNLTYSRNKVQAHFKQVQLPSKGIFAITGANGSGKSTLLQILMSCSTNEQKIGLHSSITVDISANAPLTSIVLPSSDVQEILQNIYWPIHMTPASWFILDDDFSVEAVVSLLENLRFHQDEDHDLLKEITDEKKDWFGELSGGQKIKAELVRKLFLPKHCPKVLLLDETLAPLDPVSKSLVMEKIKQVCKSSLVLIIYHTDAVSKCIAAGEFFDGNIHLENGRGHVRELCS